MTLGVLHISQFLISAEFKNVHNIHVHCSFIDEPAPKETLPPATLLGLQYNFSLLYVLRIICFIL